MEESSEESVSTVNGGYAEAARDALRIAAHLAGFWCLREIVFSIGRLNEAAYHSPVLVVEVARRFVQNHLYWCLPLIVLTLRGRLLAKWNTFEFQALSRWFSTALAFMLAAVSGGQAFNLYFNQEYAADRIVLLLLAALVAVRPIFILPFVILAIAIGGQFSFPMSGYQWQHHLLGVYRLPIHLLLVVFIGSVWRSAQAPDEDFHTHWWLPEFSRPLAKLKMHPGKFGGEAVSTTLLLVMVVVASGYWVPGVAKVRMGWTTVPNAHMGFFAAWCHGWFHDVEPHQVAAATTGMKPWALPTQWLTVLFECGSLLILWRRAAMVLLPLWILFHICAVAMYGYVFWMWALIDLALLLVVVYRPNDFCGFRWTHLLISIGLVCTSGRWLSPNQLAWFHAPVSHTFRVEAVGSAGNRHVLPPRFFAPYDYIFTMNWLHFVATQPSITGPYATTTDSAVAMTPGSQLAILEDNRPAGSNDPVLTAELERFLSTYLSNWNSVRSNATAFQLIKPPDLLNSTQDLPAIPTDEKIIRVEVIHVRSVLVADTVQQADVGVCLRVAIEDVPEFGPP